MHLALISEHASPLAALGGADSGGQNVYVAKTATLLSKLGHIVDVYTRREDPLQPETITLRPGLRIIHVEAGPARQIPKEELCDFMPRFAQVVIDRMREEGVPDLVHAHFWMSGLVAIEVKERLKVPFVVTFHALGKIRRIHQGEADHFPASRLDAERRIIEQAQRIIAECPQDEIDLVEMYGAPKERIVQIPCGFDPEEISPVDKRLARELIGVDPAARVVLQLGRMVPRKGIDDAIRGFAAATRDMTDPFEMLVVGGEVGDASVVASGEGLRLREVAREAGVESAVRFTGSRSREALRYFYSAADIFVSTPWYEPFGITPLEAMACRTPVVGSDVGGIKHTVKDGVTGVLVPPHDPEAIATAMKTLLLDDRLRDRMGRAAKERVNELFTWDAVTRDLDSLYTSVVQPAETPGIRFLREPVSLSQNAGVLQSLSRLIELDVERAVRLTTESVVAGGTVLACGNGGSAADAQHLAGELVGRFTTERKAIPAIALTADTAILTALGNDYGFESVFERQVEAHANAGDVLIAISTSGRSPNILRALEAARLRGVKTIGLLGRDGGPARKYCDVAVVVPTNVTARIQEVHQLVIHHLAAAIDAALSVGARTTDPWFATTLVQEYPA